VHPLVHVRTLVGDTCSAPHTHPPKQNTQRARAGEPWECCPRSALKRCLSRLRELHGLEIMAGFELEFVLLRRVEGGGLAGTGWGPVDDAIYCMSSALDAQAAGGTRACVCLHGCMRVLYLLWGLGKRQGPAVDLTLHAPENFAPRSHFTPPAIVLDEMVASLMAMGIGVVQWHKEAAPGQFEISTTHSERRSTIRLLSGVWLLAPSTPHTPCNKPTHAH
jgi:glutamine synthetase